MVDKAHTHSQALDSMTVNALTQKSTKDSSINNNNKSNTGEQKKRKVRDEVDSKRNPKKRGASEAN